VGTERNPLQRAAEIVRFLVENGGAQRTWGVRELATALGATPSGVHRTLAALVDIGWIERETDGAGYSLSFEMMRLAFLLSGDNPLRALARPVMEALVRECDETVLLGVFDPVRMEMIFAASVESSQPLRYVVELNRWLPIHFSASGLAIFAFLPEADREALLTSGPLTGANETTIVDPDRIREEAAKVRERGAAVSRGQRLRDAVGIAAPIFRGDTVLGDLCITVPKQRFSPEHDEARLVDTVKRHAAALSKALGGKTGTER